MSGASEGGISVKFVPGGEVVWGGGRDSTRDGNVSGTRRPSVVQNAVFARSASATSTCQYPLSKFSVVNSLDPARMSSVSSIRGRGYMRLFLSPHSVAGSRRRNESCRFYSGRGQ